MSSRHTSSRRYVSPRRSAAATATRNAILAAAASSFRAVGFAATSMRAVAEAADVAERTVYLNFPSKAELLRAVVADAAPTSDGYETFVDASDLATTMSTLARTVTEHHVRTADLVGAVHAAASVDGTARELWRSMTLRHTEDCTALAQHLAKAGVLRPWLGAGEAAATLTVLLGQSTYATHVVDLGRTPRTYQRWLTSMLSITLLG